MAEKQVETLALLSTAHANLSKAAARVAADSEQFYRHIVCEKAGVVSVVGERIFDKADVRALRDTVSALRELVDLQERLYGAREDEGAGVILLPGRDDDGV